MVIYYCINNRQYPKHLTWCWDQILLYKVYSGNTYYCLNTKQNIDFKGKQTFDGEIMFNKVLEVLFF